MLHSLSHHTYGKHCVRVSKIKRPHSGPSNTEQHEFVEASVNVMLEGDFETAFVEGDNALVVATDTCKNTIYVLAKDDPFHSIESFGMAVGSHMLRQYDHISRVTVSLREHVWRRLLDSPHAFIGGGAETPTAQIIATRGGPISVAAGIEEMVLAKTTETGFAGFHRDEFRTLVDTDDRILATKLSATWSFRSPDSDFASCRNEVRCAILSRFIDHYSRSVQETLYLMANAGLDACSEIDSITLTMPNKHHMLFDLSPFGRTNENEVFVSTDEPYGFITGTVRRLPK
jgi:urate oxidase